VSPFSSSAEDGGDAGFVVRSDLLETAPRAVMGGTA
jgi:hypothetical protein